jgi:hypothetical protein
MSDGSPFGFAFAKRDASGVPQTVYVADDRTVALGGGIQKWTLSGGTWSLAGTFKGTDGFRGLTASENGAIVTLIATSAPADTTPPRPNAVFKFVDDSDPNTVIGSVQGTVVMTSTTTSTPTEAINVFRGISLPPQ